MWVDDEDDIGSELEDNFPGYIDIPEDDSHDGRYVLQILNKRGEIDDTIIGLRDISKYINKLSR